MENLNRLAVSIREAAAMLSFSPRTIQNYVAGISQPVESIVEKSRAEITTQTGIKSGATAACGASHCAGCYDVGDGRKIHPPKIGEDYRKWLERWKPRGTVQ
jgi:hypothetical protein